MTNLVLIRHAETDMAGRFCGHSDPELNQRGRGQLPGMLNALSEQAIRRVYTSDLRRARQTAEAVAEHFGAELYLRPGLREIHFGLWEGLSWREIEGRDPALARRWAQEYPNSTAPGGELFLRFVSRVHREILFLQQEAAKLPIAVVTHAGFIRVALTSLFGMSELEAWDRVKEYGSIIALDTNHIARTRIENSGPLRSGVDFIHLPQGARK
jgi:alpha-ribazole phosphatase/probable phosphoglycerate mutase